MSYCNHPYVVVCQHLLPRVRSCTDNYNSSQFKCKHLREIARARSPIENPIHVLWSLLRD